MRLAMFDVDGTLVDSQHNIVSGLTAAMRRCGYGSPDPQSIRRIIGLSVQEGMARLMPGLSEEKRFEVARVCREEFLVQRHRDDFTEPLFEGAVEALRSLEAAGWLLGIASGKSRAGVDTMLVRHGLEGRFITLQTGDNNPGKPDPSMLLTAMAETGASPETTVMVGDTTFDMAMSQAAGTVAVGVGWGYHPSAELLAAGAGAIVDTYAELPAALDRLAGRAGCASARS